MAFREASPHAVYWLDLESLRVRAPKSARSSRRRAAAPTVPRGDAWVEVPYMESDEEYQSMKAFAASAYSGLLGPRLVGALLRDKPFRRFRNLLSDDMAATAAWTEWRTREAERRATAFLIGQGVVVDHAAFRRLAEELKDEPDDGFGCDPAE